jgi:hypothetical protein
VSVADRLLDRECISQRFVDRIEEPDFQRIAEQQPERQSERWRVGPSPATDGFWLTELDRVTHIDRIAELDRITQAQRLTVVHRIAGTDGLPEPRSDHGTEGLHDRWNVR